MNNITLVQLSCIILYGRSGLLLTSAFQLLGYLSEQKKKKKKMAVQRCHNIVIFICDVFFFVYVIRKVFLLHSLDMYIEMLMESIQLTESVICYKFVVLRSFKNIINKLNNKKLDNTRLINSICCNSQNFQLSNRCFF